MLTFIAAVFQCVLYFKTGHSGVIHEVAQLKEYTLITRGYCAEKPCRDLFLDSLKITLFEKTKKEIMTLHRWNLTSCTSRFYYSVLFQG